MNISEILKQAEKLFNKGDFEGALNRYSAAQESLIDEFKKINYFINSRTKRIFSKVQNGESFEPMAEELRAPVQVEEGEQAEQAIEEPVSAEKAEAPVVPEVAAESGIAEEAVQPVETVQPAAESEPLAEEKETPVQPEKPADASADKPAEPAAAPVEQPAAAQDDDAKLDDVLKKLDDLDEETAGGEQKTLTEDTDEAELAKKSESIDNIDIDNLLKDLDLS